MNEQEDRIRQALETHEHLTPDPEAVYARVRELSRTYHRRRRSAQAAGGAVLGAGLIAGAIQLPGLLPGGSSTQSPAAVAPAATASSAPAKPTGAQLQKDWDAYFGAGYDYDDAVRLAQLWHSKDEIGLVKAEAGRRLLAGEALPFKPSPAQVAQAREEQFVNAFYEAGYGFTDAQTLAGMWHKTPYQAKIAAGTLLKDGKKLPIEPGPDVATPAQIKAQKRLDAYFAAGYDYNDAVKLAKLWHTDTDQAKATAGKKLLAGEKLPYKP